MGRDTGGLREEINRVLRGVGALAVGFARAEEVAPAVMHAYDLWIKEGRHAGMGYMADYRELRRDPRLLLEGGVTVISMAFSYHTEAKRDSRLPHIAKYAFLPDYHKWIRKTIKQSGIEGLLGKEHEDWRLCIDTAPIFERYWAWKAGIAIIGKNGAAIIPGIGCEIFLAEIICKTFLEPSGTLANECGNCGACHKACPTGALGDELSIDCDKCLSYLTIEHRGAWINNKHLTALATREGESTIFGCDRCISICPHNTYEHRAIVEPLREVLDFAGGEAPPGSCLKRAKRILGTPGGITVEVSD